MMIWIVVLALFTVVRAETRAEAGECEGMDRTNPLPTGGGGGSAKISAPQSCGEGFWLLLACL